MLKTLRNGCISGVEGLELSSAPSINGDPLREKGTEMVTEVSPTPLGTAHLPDIANAPVANT